VTCRAEPVKVSLCHCRACQQRTGSLFGVAAFFDRAVVEVEGSASHYARIGESGHEVVFHFCPSCGSTVYWEPRRFGHLVAVAAGAFADPAFPAPTQSVWEQSRHGWLMLPADMPARETN
jgi:hypothetical protein